MKGWLFALIGVLFLAGVAWGGSWYVERQITENFAVEVTGFTFQAASATTGRVELSLEIENPTRLPGRFKGLAGTLTVAGRAFDWSLEGLQPGDRLDPGQKRTMRVVVPLTVGDVLGTAAAGILTGKVDVTFQGVLVAGAFGIYPEVPIAEERRLSLWKR